MYISLIYESPYKFFPLFLKPHFSNTFHISNSYLIECMAQSAEFHGANLNSNINFVICIAMSWKDSETLYVFKMRIFIELIW